MFNLISEYLPICSGKHSHCTRSTDGSLHRRGPSPCQIYIHKPLWDGLHSIFKHICNNVDNNSWKSWGRQSSTNPMFKEILIPWRTLFITVAISSLSHRISYKGMFFCLAYVEGCLQFFKSRYWIIIGLSLKDMKSSIQWFENIVGILLLPDGSRCFLSFPDHFIQVVPPLIYHLIPMCRVIRTMIIILILCRCISRSIPSGTIYTYTVLSTPGNMDFYTRAAYRKWPGSRWWGVKDFLSTDFVSLQEKGDQEKE